MATLLSVVQDVSIQIGIPEPATVVGNSDSGVEQLLRLITRAGEELAGQHTWSVLRKVKTFTGVASQIQTGQPPAAFSRFVPNSPLLDVNNRQALTGVTDQEQWLWLTVTNLGGISKYWSMQGGVINILPVPTTSDSFTYSYVSKNWIRPAGETDDTNDKAAFTVDTDVPLLPAELLILEGVWRWKQAKALDYAEDFETCMRRGEKLIGDDRGPHSISTTTTFRGEPFDNIWRGGTIA